MSDEECVDKFTHSSFLFCNGDTNMRFKMIPCDERERLRPVIEHGGGFLNGKAFKDSINLAAPGQKVLSENYISFKWIWDCVAKNKKLPMDRYRVSPSKANVSPGRKKKRSSGEKRPYRMSEDMEILDYIFTHDEIERVGGNLMWQEMHRDKVAKPRPWQSLRERYTKQIAPRIDKYNLSPEKLKYFTQKRSRSDKSSSKPKVKSKAYTREEDMILINYVLGTDTSDSVTGNKFWKDLKMKNLLDRSWQSMRQHFNTIIVPRIKQYNIEKKYARRMETLLGARGISYEPAADSDFCENDEQSDVAEISDADDENDNEDDVQINEYVDVEEEDDDVEEQEDVENGFGSEENAEVGTVENDKNCEEESEDEGFQSAIIDDDGLQSRENEEENDGLLVEEGADEEESDNGYLLLQGDEDEEESVEKTFDENGENGEKSEKGLQIEGIVDEESQGSRLWMEDLEESEMPPQTVLGSCQTNSLASLNDPEQSAMESDLLNLLCDMKNDLIVVDSVPNPNGQNRIQISIYEEIEDDDDTVASENEDVGIVEKESNEFNQIQFINAITAIIREKLSEFNEDEDSTLKSVPNNELPIKKRKSVVIQDLLPFYEGKRKRSISDENNSKRARVNDRSSEETPKGPCNPREKLKMKARSNACNFGM